MKVLVIGSGAREHAITWMFSKSKRISGLFIAPGNAGTEELGMNIPDVDPLDFNALHEVCIENKVNLIFVGPEAPLAAGIVDFFTEKGIDIIGPHKEAAKLESSKTFSKQFFNRHRIPTASAREFAKGQTGQFENYIKKNAGNKLVIKKDGLAGGKGVFESHKTDELLAFGTSILETDSLIVEEFLEGDETSIFVLVDGESYLMLPSCRDFKKANDHDQGPNTGGMGSICPVPWVDSKMRKTIEETIVKPSVQGIKKENLTYKGILYIGLMITSSGPKVLEYNVRFGDPETQVLLPRIQSDFGNLIDAMIHGKLSGFPLKIARESSIGVVAASPGYPGDYPRNIPIKPIPEFPEPDGLVFHASTYRKDNTVYTNGGRCFTAVGFGKDILTAGARAYSIVKKIDFEGVWYRSDIGKQLFTE